MMSHPERTHTNPQRPQSGAQTQAQGTSGHPDDDSPIPIPANSTTATAPHARNTNDGAGPHTSAGFVPVGPEPPQAHSAYHNPAAAAPQGASAATTNHAPPTFNLSTGLSPVVDASVPLGQSNFMQGVLPYQLHTHKYTTNATSDSPSPQPDGGLAPSNPCICRGCWLGCCPLAREHCEAIVVSSPQLSSRRCACDPLLLESGVAPKECPLATVHLRNWRNNYHAQSLKPPSSVPSTSTTSPGTTHPPSLSLLTHRTPPPTQDIRTPSDVAQNLDSSVSHPEPLGGDPHSVSGVQAVTTDPSDSVGPSSPSRAASRGRTNRRKAPPDAVNPPAKRPCRANTGADVSLGSGTSNQHLNENALRNLLTVIRESEWFINNVLDPGIGGKEESEALKNARCGYGVKGESILSLFIDGTDNNKCRLCGAMHPGKPLRAHGHIRKVHLGYNPYHCGERHADIEGTCEKGFPSKEALLEHMRMKKP